MGYGHDKTESSVLCLKGIPKGKLPENVIAAKIIRERYNLSILINNFIGKTRDIFKKANAVNLSNSNFLTSLMDPIVSDIY